MGSDTNDEMIKKNIHSFGDKLLESLNFFTIWQAVFLIEMYYLSINSIYNVVSGSAENSLEIPVSIIEYNQIILKYLANYEGIISYMAFNMFVCGVCMHFLKHIPKIRGYRLVITYSDYGIRCGYCMRLCVGWKNISKK